MKYLDFEKHIKKELEGSKETVQMDALLASLNLGKEPAKPKGFAIWMIIPILLLALSVFAWKYMDSSNHGSLDSYLTEEVSTSTESENEKNAFETLAISENDNSKINTNNHNEKNEDLNKSNKSPITTSNNTSKENIKSTEKSTKDNIIPPTSPTFNSTQSANNSRSSNTTLSNETTADDTFHELDVSSEESGSTLQSDSKGYMVKKIDSKISRALMTVTDLDENTYSLEGDNKVDDELFSRMKINCPSFNNAGWHMALIPEVGIFMPHKTLSNESLEQPLAYTERKESESTLEGLELGLYGMIVRDNVPFYLKAGISYSRISERMNLKYDYTVKDTTLGIISTTVSDNGDTITHVYGDIVSETTFTGSSKNHYYIHLFDVPVSIGYTTYIAGLDVGIEGGVKINFMTRGTGQLLASQKDYKNLSLDRQFKNRIGLSYFGGLMIGRNFGRFGDFYLAPRFTYYPHEFNSANNPITQKYFTIGLNAGFVYKIN